MAGQGPLTFLVTDLLGRPGARRRERVDVDVDVAFEHARLAGPVSVDLGLEGVAEGLVVRGGLRGPIELRCNRCLNTWRDELDGELVLHVTGEPDEEGVAVTSEGTLDLEEVVHDEVALALPLAPLCRPECAGLCPTCGTDLNTDPCSGHEEATDSPFAALKHLLEP